MLKGRKEALFGKLWNGPAMNFAQSGEVRVMIRGCFRRVPIVDNEGTSGRKRRGEEASRVSYWSKIFLSERGFSNMPENEKKRGQSKG